MMESLSSSSYFLEEDVCYLELVEDHISLAMVVIASSDSWGAYFLIFKNKNYILQIIFWIQLSRVLSIYIYHLTS